MLSPNCPEVDSKIVRLSGVIFAPVFLAILFLISCSALPEVSCNRSILRLEDERLTERFIENAASGEIWTSRKSRTSIEYCTQDRKRVAKALKSTVEEFLPKGRSVSYSRKLQEIFKNALDRAEIRYREESFDGSTWIIWEKEDAAQVDKIQRQLKQLLEKNPNFLN